MKRTKTKIIFFRRENKKGAILIKNTWIKNTGNGSPPKKKRKKPHTHKKKNYNRKGRDHKILNYAPSMSTLSSSTYNETK